MKLLVMLAKNAILMRKTELRVCRNNGKIADYLQNANVTVENLEMQDKV